MLKLLITFICVAFLTIVPGMADTIDLTGAGNDWFTGAFLGGNFGVLQVPDQSTGTGVIDSFLRVQASGNDKDDERGFNTSLSTPLDDKGGVFTRALALSEIPLVDPGFITGTDLYLEFLLDINQNGCNRNNPDCTDPLLSLTQIQIFTRTGDTDVYGGNPEGAPGAPSVITISGGTQVFQMSSSLSSEIQHEIQLNYALNSGSGSGDMLLYIPRALFSGLSGTTNVILYSHFGSPPGSYATNDGFEEWSVIKGPDDPCIGCGPTPVPEPTSLLLLGTGLGIIGLIAKRRKK